MGSANTQTTPTHKPRSTEATRRPPPPLPRNLATHKNEHTQQHLYTLLGAGASAYPRVVGALRDGVRWLRVLLTVGHVPPLIDGQRATD